MKELDKILEAYQKLDLTKRKAALATVVKVTGSSYRSPGAKMLITDDGKWFGSISGGCLEGDALRKARKIMLNGQAELVSYDTMDDENNALGVSLGCNGIIHVLLEPITNQNNPIDSLIEVNNSENIKSVALVYKSDTNAISIGKRFGLNDENTTDLQELISKDLDYSIKSRSSFTKEYKTDSGSFEVFIETYFPAIDLMIFGGGFDAQPVAAIAKQLGWTVSVLDECVAHLLPINFPSCQLQSFNRNLVSNKIKVKPFSAAVLMSHNYHYDLDVLKQLLNTDISYIGILGPKKKGEKMLDELAAEGIKLSNFDKHRIHNPIGLDIGADNPEEIALSIIAEVQSKFSGRSSGFLKYKSGPIHDKDPKSGEVFKQVYIKPSEKSRQSG